MKKFKRFITRKITYPLNLWHKGISKSDLDAFMGRDNWTHEKIKKLQAENLREFCRYAYQHCHYYQKVFDIYGINCDGDIFAEVHKLPSLKKEDIRQNLIDLVSDEFVNRRGLITKATGGSTGSPMVVYGDSNDYRQNGLTIARQRRWIGWEGGMEVLSLFGGFRDVPSVTNRFLKSILVNDTVINIMDKSKADYSSILKKLRENPPQVLIGYFSILKQVAYAAELEQQPVTGIGLAVACAEPIEDATRKHVEQWLGTKVYAQYGCRELGTLAQECRNQSGYHFAQDMVLCEILDDNGKPAEYGNLTITYMGNRVTPLIRYQIGDGASLDRSQCDCGLPYHRLKVIDGRVSSMIILSNGTKITSMIFPHLLKDFSWIMEYQVEQTTLDYIKIRVKRRKDTFSKESLEGLTAKLSGLLGSSVRVEWIFNEEFLQVPTGKHVYFISRLE